MSKSIRIILGVVVVLILVLGLGIGYLVSNLDSIVKGIIEKAGAEAAGVPVSVASVEISLQEGSAAINGLRIDNPAGFDTNYALQLDKAAVTLDLASIDKDPIIVESVLVDAASINFEQKDAGSNLNQIMDNLKGSAGEESGSEETSTDEVKVIIRQFDFLDAQATVTSQVLAEPREIIVPDIRLTGIGEKTSGATTTQIASQILEPIIAQVITESLGISKDQIKEGLMDKAGEKLDGLLNRD